MLVICIGIFWKGASGKGYQEMAKRDTYFCIIGKFGCILFIVFGLQNLFTGLSSSWAAIVREGLGNTVKEGKVV